MKRRTEGPTYVYRLSSDNERLLYVGVTFDVAKRLVQHSTKHWWPEVGVVRFDLFDTRAEALEEERLTILAEVPEYNIAGTDGNWWDLVARYPFLEEWETDIQYVATPENFRVIMDLLDARFQYADNHAWNVAQWHLSDVYMSTAKPGPFG